MAQSVAPLAPGAIDDETVVDRPESPLERLAGTTDSGHRSVRRVSRPALLATVSLGAVVLAGGISGVKAWEDLRSMEAATARNAAVLDTATRMATDLVTLRHQSIDEDISRVADGTTGTFHDQFTTSSVGFGELLSQGQVESIGEVKSAGLVDAADDHATVLAAVTSTVKNIEAPDGELRLYRMKLTLDLVGGRWLVSNVEFVA